MIRNKSDCANVINKLPENVMLELYPVRKIGQSELTVYITKEGCREFWGNESGSIGEDSLNDIINMLWEYRKAYNHDRYQLNYKIVRALEGVKE